MRRALAWLLGAVVALGLAGARAADDPEPDTPPQILVMLPLPPDHFRPDRHYAGGYGDALGRVARRRVAAQIAREHGLQVQSDWPMPLLGLDCFVMAAPAEAEAARALQALAQDRRVAWAQPMQVFRGQGHTDPLFTLQPAASAWQLDALHAVTTGRGVRVAVIDSGVDEHHPDLAGQLLANRNLVGPGPVPGEDHGTAVAGIVAARADDGLGVAGIAPGARLLALRACTPQDAATRCTSLALAAALHAAIAEDAGVINLSLAGPADRLLEQLLALALQRGIVVVAAVDPALPRGGFPAAMAGVVAVAALADDAPPAGGPRPGVWRAPGRDIPVPGPPARWHFVSGNSYAAAHLSGLFALLRELAPRAGAAALVARPDGAAVDACATLAAAAGTCPCGCELAGSLPPAAAWRR